MLTVSVQEGKLANTNSYDLTPVRYAERLVPSPSTRKYLCLLPLHLLSS
jgi:hypothetical protein